MQRMSLQQTRTTYTFHDIKQVAVRGNRLCDVMVRRLR